MVSNRGYGAVQHICGIHFKLDIDISFAQRKLTSAGTMRAVYACCQLMFGELDLPGTNNG
jgi:hypothetical protein